MDMKDRGHRAAQLLQDPLLIEALDLVEHELTQIWKGANTTLETREQAWHTLRGHHRFKDILQLALETGKYDQILEDKYNV